MARQVTKASQNRYCQARLEAAKCNDRFASRASAADELPGVTEESLKKYELGITRPPNDVVALMADAYNAPELVLWYCANECPLGKHCREVPEMPPERALIRLQNAKAGVSTVVSTLSSILDDGVIDDTEAAMLPGLLEEIIEVKRRIDETMTVLQKLQRQSSEPL